MMYANKQQKDNKQMHIFTEEQKRSLFDHSIRFRIQMYVIAS